MINRFLLRFVSFNPQQGRQHGRLANKPGCWRLPCLPAWCGRLCGQGSPNNLNAQQFPLPGILSQEERTGGGHSARRAGGRQRLSPPRYRETAAWSTRGPSPPEGFREALWSWWQDEHSQATPSVLLGTRAGRPRGLCGSGQHRGNVAFPSPRSSKGAQVRHTLREGGSAAARAAENCNHRGKGRHLKLGMEFQAGEGPLAWWLC